MTLAPDLEKIRDELNRVTKEFHSESLVIKKELKELSFSHPCFNSHVYNGAARLTQLSLRDTQPKKRRVGLNHDTILGGAEGLLSLRDPQPKKKTCGFK